MAGENDTIGIYQELLNRNAVPPEHQETVGELVRRGVLKSGQPKPEVGGAEATLRQFNDALTFGFYDKAVAGAKSLIGGARFSDNINREQQRTQEAGKQVAPWLIGQTAGNVVQGLAMMPAAPAVASYQAAKEAMKPAVGAVRGFLEGIPEAARYGAVYGSANAAGHSTGSAENQLLQVGTGAAEGAILGPAAYLALHGAGSIAAIRQNAQQQRAQSNQARAAEARSVGIDNPLPGIVSESPVIGPITRAVGAGIGGNPVGARAAENINQLTTGINRTLSGPLEGQEAGDLGRLIQNDLRRQLTMPSRSADEIAGMSKAELEKIVGPVSQEGFQPPRPQVDPIQPRAVDPIQPRDIGPEPQPPNSSGTQNIADVLALRERQIEAAVAEHNKMTEAARAVEARYKPTFDKYNELSKQEQTIRETFEKMNTEGNFIKMRLPGENVQAYQNRVEQLARDHAAIVDQINKMQPEITLANTALNRYGTHETRLENIRNLYAQRDQTQAKYDRMAAADEGQRIEFAKQQKDFAEARTRAAAEAADETARIKEQARVEAEQATAQAMRAAEERYQRQTREGNTGFRTGTSKESYPTEMSAAYELAYRETPKVRVNPMGDGYGQTATTQLLESVAKEGKQSLKIRDFDGKAFDIESGGLTPAFKSHLRSRIGSDMTERIEALAEIRARGPIAQPGIEGMRSLLSDMRALARDAEKSRYTPQPRTEDAALLRRMAGTIQRDLYDAIGRAGRPESFSTASGNYKVLDAGRTQFGDKAPTDSTYYVKPAHFKLLTKGDGNYDKTHSIPATLSLKESQGRIGYYKNQEGAFDRSSMIPYNRNPEPGLVPIQVWADGTRITYGSPVISRGTTSGERSVAMFKNVDEQYSTYVNELRKPLSKVFGEKVDGVQAMDRLVTAANKGETGLLGAYMRVMEDKVDPTRGAAAVIYHATGGGKDLSRFNQWWRELPPSSRRVLFDSPSARKLEQELNRYVRVGERLEKFTNASRQKAIVDPSRITHLMTAAAVYTHFPAAVAMVGGNAMAARVLSSPRLVRWMTDMPKSAHGGFDTAMFRKHMARLGALEKTNESEAARVTRQAVLRAISEYSHETRH